MTPRLLLPLLLCLPAVLGMDEFLPGLFGEAPAMSEEQAKWVTGVWNQTGGHRLDGSVADELLKQAVAAAGDGDVDFGAVASEALTPGAGPLSFQLFIPHIDAKTGIFWGYYLIGKPGDKPTVTRLVGMGEAGPDGVLLSGTKSEDTATWYGLVKSKDEMVVIFSEGLEEWNDDHTAVTDNQVIAQYQYTKLPDSYIKPALRSVVSDQEGDVSGMIAATDRGAHGLDEKEGGA